MAGGSDKPAAGATVPEMWLSAKKLRKWEIKNGKGGLNHGNNHHADCGAFALFQLILALNKRKTSVFRFIERQNRRFLEMKMQDLEGKRVKISAGTITAKGESGKTCGMVRGIRKYQDMPKAKQFELFPIVRGSGIWGNTNNPEMIDHVIFDGTSLFYINDTRPLKNFEHLREMFTGNDDFSEMFPGEIKHHENRLEIAKKAASAGMIVINCEIV